MRYCDKCGNDLMQGYLHLDRVNGQDGRRCGKCWKFFERRKVNSNATV